MPDTPLARDPDGFIDLRHHRLDLASATRHIDDLDFATMIDRNVNEAMFGWTAQKWALVESEYKRWLILRRTFEDERLPPTQAIDLFWHEHILDTRRYLADSAAIFGYYHHHFPYFGTRGEADHAALLEAGERMFQRYQERFGTEPVEHV